MSDDSFHWSNWKSKWEIRSKILSRPLNSCMTLKHFIHKNAPWHTSLDKKVLLQLVQQKNAISEADLDLDTHKFIFGWPLNVGLV